MVLTDWRALTLGSHWGLYRTIIVYGPSQAFHSFVANLCLLWGLYSHAVSRRVFTFSSLNIATFLHAVAGGASIEANLLVNVVHSPPLLM